MTQTNDLLSERYGNASGKRRPLVIGFVSALLVAFFSFAIYANFFGKPVASVEVSSYEKLDIHHIKANFTARTGDKPAGCVFKAFDTGGATVGYAEVEIPANNDDTKALSVVVKTIAAAAVLRADGCSVK
ncbi:MAG: hypothetical protein RL166_507 [Actinomycetota bacterium]